MRAAKVMRNIIVKSKYSRLRTLPLFAIGEHERKEVSKEVQHRILPSLGRSRSRKHRIRDCNRQKCNVIWYFSCFVCNIYQGKALYSGYWDKALVRLQAGIPSRVFVQLDCRSTYIDST